MSDTEEFEQTQGGSDTVPSTAGAIKKNAHCMLKDHPCKVTQYSTAKPGKHGSAKATIVGIDIFTGKKYEDTAPTAATVRVPIVNKTEYEVADVNEDDLFVSLILADGSLKTDLKLAGDEKEVEQLLKIWQDNNENKQVYYTVIKACGQEKIIAGRCKE